MNKIYFVLITNLVLTSWIPLSFASRNRKEVHDNVEKSIKQDLGSLSAARVIAEILRTITEESAIKEGTAAPVRYCNPATPCAWSFFKLKTPVDGSDYLEISNTYCVCRPDERCRMWKEHESEKFTEHFCVYRR